MKFAEVIVVLLSVGNCQVCADGVVFLVFDGTESSTFAFPNITSQHDTGPPPSGTGLGDFTGAPFDVALNEDEAALETAITGLIADDFGLFDVAFVTSQPAGLPGVDYKVFAIDDTAYTFVRAEPFEGPDDARLFGKADIDSGFARTWAGSFSLTAANQPYGGEGLGVLSQRPLSAENRSLEEIAQALANNAAHEIAHLFGVGHEGRDADQPSQRDNLMQTDSEFVMATTDKGFSPVAVEQLLTRLGPAQVPEPSAAMLLMSAMIAGTFFTRSIGGVSRRHLYRKPARTYFCDKFFVLGLFVLLETWTPRCKGRGRTIWLRAKAAPRTRLLCKGT